MDETGGDRPRAADWRLVVEARLNRVKADLAALGPRDPLDEEGQQWRRTADDAVAVVESALAHRDGFSPRAITSWWSGWHIERAWRALHEAEIATVAAEPGLDGRLPSLQARVWANLPDEDPRRRALEELRPGEFPPRVERAVVVDALRAAFDNSDSSHAGARALRNKLIAASVVLFVLNTVLGVMGVVRPGTIPLCVRAREELAAICPGGPAPAGIDLFLVQLLGAFGALLAAAVPLLRRRPSLSPYVMIGYQALIKVMLGAALAVVGVLALSAGVVTGLIGITSQGALLLWAVILGYGQQIGTRLLDNYADRVMHRARPLPEDD
ncbi:hypothetical protein [Umezawaea beigongshangensis]|uniref:hypothetical protein n=1 Tax=Umezawaea beigongshangensis TaxID=2780383 RepID=UPI0018F1B6CC|nr:hypothetical protein [Umezawaea beigongshangensis]